MEPIRVATSSQTLSLANEAPRRRLAEESPKEDEGQRRLLGLVIAAGVSAAVACPVFESLRPPLFPFRDGHRGPVRPRDPRSADARRARENLNDPIDIDGNRVVFFPGNLS